MLPPLPASESPALPLETARCFRVVQFDRVDPDRQQIGRLVQLSPERESHRRWLDQIDELLPKLAGIMRPRGVFRIDEVHTFERTRLVLASGATYEGAIGSYLAPAQFVATFVATIGSAVERLSRGWLRAGKVMPSLIADAIASEAAEATAQRLRAEVRAWAHTQGLETTLAYSPGYCGLSIGQQTTLFRSLPARLIHVRLTPSCLMVPIKSISALIGIGSPEHVDPDRCACEACDHETCVQRRTPFRPPPA